MTSKERDDLITRLNVLYNYISNVRNDTSKILGFFVSNNEQEIYHTFTQAMTLVTKCESLLLLEPVVDDHKPAPEDGELPLEERELIKLRIAKAFAKPDSKR